MTHFLMLLSGISNYYYFSLVLSQVAQAHYENPEQHYPT